MIAVPFSDAPLWSAVDAKALEDFRSNPPAFLTVSAKRKN